MNIEITEHFQKRFRQRVANSKRASIFANRAFKFGKSSCDFKNATFAKEINKKEIDYGSVAKVYSNYIYWFYNNKAVTIYPLPQNLRGRL